MKLHAHFKHLILTATLILGACSWAYANSTTTHEDIEKLKKDIIELNAEFKNIEQEFLYPASVDTALFVSVDTGQFFKIEAIEARINNQPVIGHFYTKKQREALEKGGIHKLSQIHVKPGTHQLVVTVIGKDAQGGSLKRGITHTFEKTKQSLGLELQLFDNLNSQALDLRIKSWSL